MKFKKNKATEKTLQEIFLKVVSVFCNGIKS